MYIKFCYVISTYIFLITLTILGYNEYNVQCTCYII